MYVFVWSMKGERRIDGRCKRKEEIRQISVGGEWNLINRLMKFSWKRRY